MLVLHNHNDLLRFWFRLRKFWFRFRIQTILSTVFQQQKICTKPCLFSFQCQNGIIFQKAGFSFQIFLTFLLHFISVADPDPGLGIRCLFDPWIRDPGSGMGFFRIPDLGSRIPRPYFEELIDNFFGKKFYNSLKIGPNFFLQHFKTKIIYNFVKFCGYIKRFDL